MDVESTTLNEQSELGVCVETGLASAAQPQAMQTVHKTQSPVTQWMGVRVTNGSN